MYLSKLNFLWSRYRNPYSVSIQKQAVKTKSFQIDAWLHPAILDSWFHKERAQRAAKGSISQFCIYSFLFRKTTLFTRVMARLNRRAYPKESIWNPLTQRAANEITIALIIKRNNPKLKRVIGRVNRMSSGRTVALSTEMSNAAMRACHHGSMLMPGKTWANTSINKAEKVRRTR